MLIHYVQVCFARFGTNNLKNVKNSWRSVTFSKVFLRVFSRFLDCTNCTKSRKASHIDHHEGADPCYISRLKAVQKYTNIKFCQNDTPFLEAILRESKAMELQWLLVM